MKQTRFDHIFFCYLQADGRIGQESNVQDLLAINGTYTNPRYETMLQKHNENTRLTEELLRRIAVLEEKMDSCITCRIITKV